MYASILGFAAMAMIIIVASLGQFAAYAHAETLHQIQQTSKLYLRHAEDELTDQIGTQYEAAMTAGTPYVLAAGTSFTLPKTESTAGSNAYCPTQAKSTKPCAFQMSWSATIVGSSSVAGGQSANETSSNINNDVGEQRVSAILTTTASTPSGTPLSATRETVTLRLYDFAPYATIVATTNAKSFYAGSWGTTASTEDDVSGCASSACGDSTTISSFGKCQMDPAANIPIAAQAQWCADHPTTTSFNHPIAAPQNTYPPTSVLTNATWTNSNLHETP